VSPSGRKDKKLIEKELLKKPDKIPQEMADEEQEANAVNMRPPQQRFIQDYYQLAQSYDQGGISLIQMQMLKGFCRQRK